MISKKDLVIVALATFCLTATLFLILPIRSEPYDPWIDTNDDGSINILEGILLSNHFLTNGDPAKNVSVSNWPEPSYNVQWIYMNVSPGGGQVDCGGYSRMSLQPVPSGASMGIDRDVTVYLRSISYGFDREYFPSSALNVSFHLYSNGTMSSIIPAPIFMTETKFNFCYLDWAVADPPWPDGAWIELCVLVYLRNE